MAKRTCSSAIVILPTIGEGPRTAFTVAKAREQRHNLPCKRRSAKDCQLKRSSNASQAAIKARSASAPSSAIDQIVQDPSCSA